MDAHGTIRFRVSEATLLQGRGAAIRLGQGVGELGLWRMRCAESGHARQAHGRRLDTERFLRWAHDDGIDVRAVVERMRMHDDNKPPVNPEQRGRPRTSLAAASMRTWRRRLNELKWMIFDHEFAVWLETHGPYPPGYEHANHTKLHEMCLADAHRYRLPEPSAGGPATIEHDYDVWRGDRDHTLDLHREWLQAYRRGVMQAQESAAAADAHDLSGGRTANALAMENTEASLAVALERDPNDRIDS